MPENVSPEEFERLSQRPVTSTFEAWRGLAGQLAFEPADFDLLDVALSVAPDLRMAAFVVKLTRLGGAAYPIESVAQLEGALGEEPIEVGEFIVDRRLIREDLSPEAFPLIHEGY